MSELTVNEATALMAAGMYASPPTEERMKEGIERAESWLAAHDREVKAAVLREAAGDAHPFYPTGGHVTVTRGGLRQWLNDRADRIESGSQS